MPYQDIDKSRMTITDESYKIALRTVARYLLEGALASLTEKDDDGRPIEYPSMDEIWNVASIQITEGGIEDDLHEAMTEIQDGDHPVLCLETPPEGIIGSSERDIERTVARHLRKMVEMLGPSPRDVARDDVEQYLRTSVDEGMPQEIADRILVAYEEMPTERTDL